MKQKKAKWKILLIIAGAFLSLIAGTILYINTTYTEVNPEIRIVGFIVDKVLGFNDEASLIKAGEDSLSKSIMDLEFADNIDSRYVTINRDDGTDINLLVLSLKDGNQNKDAVGLLWLHGGGYALRSFDFSKLMLPLFLEASNSVIVLPEYTLSVEAPYPAALNDSFATLHWMHDNAESLGINKNQLFIGGDSAGGGLAAATALYTRDNSDIKLAFQFPIYPMLNAQMDMASAIDNTSFIWNSKRNYAAWKIYLGDLFLNDKVPAYASPSLADDYSGLPPAFTYVGALDPFKDETVKYISDLNSAGIQADVHVYEGAFHAFDIFNTRASIVKKAHEQLLGAYKHAAENYFAPLDNAPQN